MFEHMEEKEFPKLVICIPTYNRSKVIESVLNCELQMLKERHVDVILYDSSEDAETEMVYKKYRSAGFDNLFLKKVDPKVASNQKIYMIWQDMEYSMYDYVWLIHDHRVCSVTAIEYILQALTENRDIYILSLFSKEQFGQMDVLTLQDFLKECVYFLTLFGASIINIKTFVAGTDWKQLESKYLGKRTINFSQLGFYYERANQLKDFKARILQFPKGSFVSPEEKVEFRWYGDIVRVWSECWASTILNFPDVYKEKKSAIRDIDQLHLSIKNFIDYRRDGVYNCRIFFKYAKWLRIASSENILRYFFIAAVPPGLSAKLYERRFVRQIIKAQKNHKKIIIFGAAKYAFTCAEFMKKNNISFDAFIVSSMKNNSNVILEHPVYLAEEYYAVEKNVFSIIAVAGYGNRKEIENYLEIINMKSDSVYFDNIS